MMKFLSVLFVSMLTLCATTANAQSEITVCSGEDINAYAPLCGFGNMDGDQTSQMIYPAEALEALKGKQITAIVFYPKDVIDWTTTNTWSMTETEQASFAKAELLSADVEEVAKTVGVYDKDLRTWTITLDRAYIYKGGNLLVQALMPKDYNGNKTFYGAKQSAVTALVNYNNMGYGYEVEASKFLPKTTFVYEDAKAIVNSISEDFESYADADFSISPVGDWTYIDADGYSTYVNPGMTALPNANAAMAFMLVNTKDVRYTAYHQAHSGSHFLISPRTRDGVQNDNWLVSPELTLSKGGHLSFWALGATGYASLQVLCSTTDNKKESFTQVGDTYTKLNGTWTEFKYEFPANVKYFAIRDVTDSYAQSVIFGLDDITLVDDETTGIVNVNVNDDENFLPIEGDRGGLFNVLGQRISAAQKGLVIRNGKKYLVK